MGASTSVIQKKKKEDMMNKTKPNDNVYNVLPSAPIFDGLNNNTNSNISNISYPIVMAQPIQYEHHRDQNQKDDNVIVPIPLAAPVITAILEPPTDPAFNQIFMFLETNKKKYPHLINDQSLNEIKNQLITVYHNFNNLNTIVKFLKSLKNIAHFPDFSVTSKNEILNLKCKRHSIPIPLKLSKNDHPDHEIHRWPFDFEKNQYIIGDYTSLLDKYLSFYSNDINVKIDKKTMLLFFLCLEKWKLAYQHNQIKYKWTRKLLNLIEKKHWATASILFQGLIKQEKEKENQNVKREEKGEVANENKLIYFDIITTKYIENKPAESRMDLHGMMACSYAHNNNESRVDQDFLFKQILEVLNVEQVNDLFTNTHDNLLMVYLQHSDQRNVNLNLIQTFLDQKININHLNLLKESVIDIAINRNLPNVLQLFIQHVEKYSLPLF